MTKQLFEVAITHNEMLLEIKMALEALYKQLEKIREGGERKAERKRRRASRCGSILTWPHKRGNIQFYLQNNFKLKK